MRRFPARSSRKQFGPPRNGRDAGLKRHDWFTLAAGSGTGQRSEKPAPPVSAYWRWIRLSPARIFTSRGYAGRLGRLRRRGCRPLRVGPCTWPRPDSAAAYATRPVAASGQNFPCERGRPSARRAPAAATPFLELVTKHPPRQLRSAHCSFANSALASFTMRTRAQFSGSVHATPHQALPMRPGCEG